MQFGRGVLPHPSNASMMVTMGRVLRMGLPPASTTTRPSTMLSTVAVSMNMSRSPGTHSSSGTLMRNVSVRSPSRMVELLRRSIATSTSRSMVRLRMRNGTLTATSASAGRSGSSSATRTAASASASVRPVLPALRPASDEATACWVCCGFSRSMVNGAPVPNGDAVHSIAYMPSSSAGATGAAALAVHPTVGRTRSSSESPDASM